jgi:hypothetical protein
MSSNTSDAAATADPAAIAAKRDAKIKEWQQRMGPNYLHPDVVSAQAALAWSIGDTMPMPKPAPAHYTATSPTMIGQVLRSASIIMLHQQLLIEDLQKKLAAAQPSSSST